MKIFTTLLLSIGFFAGAKAQTPNQVRFIFHHYGGVAPLELEGAAFPIWNNKAVMLTHAGFYISEIELLRADSSRVPLTDLHLLVDASADSSIYPAGPWDVESIIGLTLHLGVDSAHNHLDPSIYPEGHPLAHQKFQMHWGWLAGYRFMAIEGMVDNNNDQVPESEFQFHNIGDPLYRAVHLSGAAQAKDGVLNIHIDLDYARLFANMAMTGNLIEHGSNPDNFLMMENAAGQGFVRMSTVTASDDLAPSATALEVAPNPVAASTGIRYTFSPDRPGALRIFSTSGQTIATFDELSSNGTVRFDCTYLPNGVYHCILLQAGTPVARQSFVVNR